METNTISANIKMGSNGRLVIPAHYRKALEIEEGDKLIITLVNKELHISRIDEAIRSAQALVEKYIPDNRSLADELIQERRLEAKREGI